jgi:uncharacterized membrane protein
MTLKQRLDSLAEASLAGPREGGTAPRQPPVMPFLALTLIALLTPLHGLWVAQLLLVPALLVVPGVILLRALRVPGAAIASLPVYIPCASLIVLLGSGLAVDLIGPLVGLAAPLRPGPLLVGLEIICVALLAASMNAPPEVEIPWQSLAAPARQAWPLLLPLAAAAGALRLNSGHGSLLAVLALTAIVVALLWAFCLAPRLSETLLAVMVYAAGLGLMWSFSLRGNLVYGFDIASEYHSLQQTILSGAWHPAHPGDAYGAMLSVTVLPAELHDLSGLPALLVLKVAYPAIAAFFPVAVLGLARRVLAPRWAFAAAAFVLMQATFFQQLPGLARQEIAMVLFAGLIAAVLDTSLARRPHWALVGLLAAGLVVSHYSTTYLAIALLAIAAAVQFGVSWLRPGPRVTGSVLVALVIALAGAAVWYGPLTRSQSNLSQFVAVAAVQGIDLLPNSTGDPLSTYLQGESSPPLDPAQFQQLARSYYQEHYAFVRPLPDAGQAQYALRPAAARTPAARLPAVGDTLSLGDLLVQQLTNLLAAVGALLLVLRRRTPALARQVGVFSLAGLIILAVVRLSGTVAQAYNPERAFLQTMVVLAIALCWPLQSAWERWKRLQPAIVAVAAGSLAVFLVGSAGLSGAVLGGGTATNLANSGVDYEDFYMTTPELSAAAWLTRAAPPGQLVYADEYGQLRLEAAGRKQSGLFGAVTPLTLDQYAWVYASRTNVIDKLARTTLRNDSATYAFPFYFLNQNYDVVFTDGSSEVFHR